MPTVAAAALHIRPLDPFDFFERSAAVFRTKTAVIDGTARRTYRQMLDRVTRLATALQARGIRSGERVAVLAPNASAALEATHAGPLAGGVLCTLNTRLSAGEIAYILERSGASPLIYDAELARLAVRLSTIASGAADVYELVLAGADPAAVVRRAYHQRRRDHLDRARRTCAHRTSGGARMRGRRRP